MPEQFLTKSLVGPSVWSGAELQGRDDWIARFSADELREMDGAVEQIQLQNKPLFSVTRDDFAAPRLTDKFAGIQRELEDGRGFQVLRGAPVSRYSLEQNRILIWVLTLLLGSPQEQDGAGNLMHSVSDTGQKLEQNSSLRGYQTDGELTFHNDGGDAFILMCLRTALSGGESKLVSVPKLFNELLRIDPSLVHTLQEPFYFDTRNQHVEGKKLQATPIMNFAEGKVSALYKRMYIESAQRFPEAPRLTSEQMRALDAVEKICADPAIQLSFFMEPGDIQIGNNYSILHSRTKYQDHQEEHKKRYLLRTWLTLPNGRPLPPIFAETREFSTAYARRQSGASARADH
jgi:hypothetical protein